MKIAVAGTGYVGLSIATLLAQRHQVIAVDVVPEKVEKINRRESPIQDEYIEKYLAENDLDLTATLDGEKAYRDADFVVIAAPTNYDPKKNFFDTTHVEEVLRLVASVNPSAVVVIKSAVPVGYTKSLEEKFKGLKVLFSPEFLRESKALYDNLYPSRIIVGFNAASGPSETAQDRSSGSGFGRQDTLYGRETCLTEEPLVLPAFLLYSKRGCSKGCRGNRFRLRGRCPGKLHSLALRTDHRSRLGDARPEI